MVKKGRAKKQAKLEAAAAIEDLDLELSDVDERPINGVDDDNDDDVVHNRRGKKTARRGARNEDSMSDDSGDELDVLPSDAHKLDGYGDEEFGGAGGGSYQEEEDLAVATGKTLRKRVTDDDFAVGGVSLGSVRSAVETARKQKQAELDAAPVIEAVERDFASLTTSERLAILKKESPELLKMLDDVKRYLGEVKELAKPLHSLLYERKVSDADKNLVSFLETKVQLMLSYCMHVTFYLLLKSEGKKVAGHPVIDNLVEIRVYLEKMWPLEEKLQYSLNRLLSGKSAAAAHLDELRPLQGADSGLFEASRSAGNAEARERRKQMREMREAEELEKEEQAAMTRVRTKKASALNALPSTAVAPLSYQEDEDQYFAKLTGRGLDDDDDDDDDEPGLSLMDALRKRQRQQQALLQEKEANSKRGAAAEDGSESGEGDGEDFSDDDSDGMGDDLDEGDMLAMEGSDDMDDDDMGVDGDEEADYDALWEEEEEREREKAARAATPKEKLTVAEVNRRKAGKKIESHRGLTKARPKDRKTPRVAQRRKYERGLRVHKAQSRQFQPEPEGGFSGVRSIKPGVVRGKSLL